MLSYIRAQRLAAITDGSDGADVVFGTELVGVYGQQQHRQCRGFGETLFLCGLQSDWWGGQAVATIPVSEPWAWDEFGLGYGDSPGAVRQF